MMHLAPFGNVGGAIALMFMVFFWLLVVGIGAWVLSRLFPRMRGDGTVQNPGTSGSQTALEIAKQRYARGEITKTEYEEVRRTLLE